MSNNYNYYQKELVSIPNYASFEDIVLQHNKSILKSRKDAVVSVTVGDKKLESPVILSNMPSCQNEIVLDTFNKKRWPYVYYRTRGTEDIYNFVEKINLESWHLKSISVGVQDADYELLKRIKERGLKLDWITIDVALIWNEHHEEYIKKVRALWPDVYLIAGNFCHVDCADWLSDLGVNCGKFNIGVSALCRTRQNTGFGTYLSDFIDTAQTSDLDLIYDGGLTILDEEKGEVAYGDIFKALNFGAQFVMSSSLFRWAHELSNNGVVLQYGNSTAEAKGYSRNVEGAVKAFKSQYDLEDQMRKIIENLQSSVSYAGLTDIKDAYESCGIKKVK